ncbi:MAG: CBS domain-containing protein [Candidatus Aenigmatarchaeota archaeon]
MVNGFVKVVGKNWSMSIELSRAGFDRRQKVIELVEKNPVYCYEEDSILSVIDKIIEKGHRRLPVVTKSKKLVGIITTMDILGAFLRNHDFKEPISSIMNREVIFCDAEEILGNVLLKFKFSRRGGLPIVKNGVLVGMISERDLVRRFASLEFGVKVEEVMTKKPFYVNSKISIIDVLKIMVNTGYRRFPVVENGKLVGIVTSADLLYYLREINFNPSLLSIQIFPKFEKEVYYVKKEMDVSEAIKEMIKHDVGGLPVVDDEKNLEGIITERDILEEII